LSVFGKLGGAIIEWGKVSEKGARKYGREEKRV